MSRAREEETPAPPRRQGLRLILGCIACAAPLRLLAQEGSRGPDAWQAAQDEIQRGASMAGQVAAAFDGLASAVGRALAEKDRLTALLRKQQSELAELKADKERLLEEYRTGLFCSGCNQTKSQILAKGERFPHPNQKIIRPTEQQIKDKERQLQAPIDALQNRIQTTQRELQQETQRAAEGVDQLVHGLRLWNTAATYWTNATGYGLRRRAEQLRAMTEELADLLFRARHAAGLPGAAPGLATEAAVIGRQLQQRQDDQAAFGDKASEVSAELLRRRNAQVRRIAEALDKPLVRQAFAAPADYRAVSRLDAPAMLGVFFQMGSIPNAGAAGSGIPPLPTVSGFVDAFKASPTDLYAVAVATVPQGQAQAAPAPAAASGTPAKPSLLDKLP